MAIRFLPRPHEEAATGYPPLFTRPTPHAGTSGFRPGTDLPLWILAATDCRIVKDQAGPDLDERPLYIKYVTEPGDSFGQICPFLPSRCHPTVLPRLEALNASGSRRLPDGYR